MKTYTIDANNPKYKIKVSVFENNAPKGVVLFVHGMAEHKERYYTFMEYLCENGFTCAIYDHRGHGESVIDIKDYGYLYDETNTHLELVNDLDKVRIFLKNSYYLPIYIYAHSMGTLVARNYIQTKDSAIQGLILSGAPFYNIGSYPGYLIARISSLLRSSHYPNKLLDFLSFSTFHNKFNESNRNAWISSNKKEIFEYNNDPLCGFMFTNNGFIVLYSLLIRCFNKNKYIVSNTSLPIYFIGGSNDPVIGTNNQFVKQITYMKELGYTNVTYKKYERMRHDILHEENKEIVYEDILHHLNKIIPVH